MEIFTPTAPHEKLLPEFDFIESYTAETRLHFTQKQPGRAETSWVESLDIVNTTYASLAKNFDIANYIWATNLMK